MLSNFTTAFTVRKICVIFGLINLQLFIMIAQGAIAADSWPTTPIRRGEDSSSPSEKLALKITAEPTPAGKVTLFHEALLGIMREADQLGFKGRYNQLKPLILGLFNLRLMTNVAAGSYWASMSSDQREAMLKEFTHMTITTYANRFDGFNGEKFETLHTQASQNATNLVKTQIITGKGEKIAIDYLMLEHDGNWSIIDIFLKGAISELATKRAEYTSILKRSSIDELLAQLKAHSEELSIVK